MVEAIALECGEVISMESMEDHGVCPEVLSSRITATSLVAYPCVIGKLGNGSIVGFHYTTPSGVRAAGQAQERSRI